MNYTIASPSSSGDVAFQISFQNRNDPTGFVVTIGDINVQSPYGIFDLGFNHNSDVQFLLSGTESGFSTLGPYTNWMSYNLDTLGCMTLRELCIPGSHDSGMSQVSAYTAGVIDSELITQTLDIGGQLNAGIRWFDVRPVIAGGAFSTGHYSNTRIGTKGGDGQNITNIINQINAFTATNNELIILELSHSFYTDGPANYPPLNTEQWTELMQQMQSIQYLAALPSDVTDISTIPLSDFNLATSAAVVVIIRENVDPSAYPTTGGFYNSDYYPVYNQYSNTDDLDTMEQDQISKLQTQRTSTSDQTFQLSWTLTEVIGIGSATTSVLDLAAEADQNLYYGIWPYLTFDSYPNVIEIDNVDELGTVTALAMAINNYLASYSAQCTSSKLRKRAKPFTA